MRCDHNKGKNQNLILDFSHVYPENIEDSIPAIRRIDCSDIEGTNLYLTKAAEKELRKRLRGYGPGGIHFLDSGNYHYVTKIMTDRIDEPFSLILFDHHTDMQSPMIEGMISCGDWARSVLLDNPQLQQLILIGPKKADIQAIYNDKEFTAKQKKRLKEKLIAFSAEELRADEGHEKVERIRMDVPFYISIDKDVLDERYCETNWNQGRMSLSLLEHLLRAFLETGNILGIDICGECQQGIPLPEYMEAEEKNAETNRKLFEFLTHYIRRKSTIPRQKAPRHDEKA